jgi:lantibiotic modifying enzyme
VDETADEAIERTAQEGAHSVYRYVARTAEPVPDGVRWQTLDWHNRPHYSTAVFDGVAGIVLFLADYHRLTGDGPARDLALGGLRWCSSPERPADPADDWHRHSLVRGEAGVGMAWLRLAAATGAGDLLAPAAAVGERLLRQAPGPVTDWQDGATGEGVFLLRLAEATGDARFLGGAVARGEWLARVAIRDERGQYWPWQVDDPQFASWYGLSFIPGAAGIGHFLLSLAAATGEGRWGALAWEAGQTLLRQAVPDRGGLNWPDTLDGLANGEALRCQWCYGAPGVGLFFVKAHEVLGPVGAPKALATALAAGETTYRYGDVRRNAVQCHGLAGNGELFLELYRTTRERRWRERAHDFARLAFAYRRETPQGEVWQADDPGYDSPDFLYGASGTGHFFLRLWHPDEVSRPLL